MAWWWAPFPSASFREMPGIIAPCTEMCGGWIDESFGEVWGEFRAPGSVETGTNAKYVVCNGILKSFAYIFMNSTGFVNTRNLQCTNCILSAVSAHFQSETVSNITRNVVYIIVFSTSIFWNFLCIFLLSLFLCVISQFSWSICLYSTNLLLVTHHELDFLRWIFFIVLLSCVVFFLGFGLNILACNFDVSNLLRVRHKSETRYFNFQWFLTISVSILHKKVENLE